LDNDNSNNNKGPDIQNVKGHVTYTKVEGNSNTTNVSVSGDIKVEEDIVSNLDPEFQKSIADFTELLKKEFEGRTATAEQISSLNDRINELAKEFESIRKGQEITDEEKKDDIKSKLRNLADALLALAPDVAEKVAQVTPLAPFSASIGKGVGYLSDLIKRKLPK
jgi:molecular chaperone GrpE (heat shock protein)